MGNKKNCFAIFDWVLSPKEINLIYQVGLFHYVEMDWEQRVTAYTKFKLFYFGMIAGSALVSICQILFLLLKGK